MKVEREYGWIEDGEEAGNSTYTITIEGTHIMDEFVLVELGIDTTWADVPPPDPEVVPPAPDPGDPDQLPQYVDENGEVRPLVEDAATI
jgi:hypothetical protein